MKNIIFFMFIVHSTMSYSQFAYPYIQDLASHQGSRLHILKYGILASTIDPSVTKKAKKFRSQYKKRLQYFTASFRLKKKINDKLDMVKNRYQVLVTKNQSLSFFSYSKKKNNVKILHTISIMLGNLSKELAKQDAINVILGEKLNLYINSRASLSKINRLMDTVEGNIGQSRLLSRLMRKL